MRGHKTQRGLRHRELRAFGEEREQLRVLRDQPASEGVHARDAHALPRRGRNSALPVAIIERVVAEQYALEQPFADNLGDICARHMRREHDVPDEPLLFGLQKPAVHGVALFP